MQDARHPQLALALTNLGELSRQQGRNEPARSAYQQALHIQEQRLGPSHPKILWTKSALLTIEERVQDAEQTVFKNGRMAEPENVLLCACGCGRKIDMVRGEWRNNWLKKINGDHATGSGAPTALPGQKEPGRLLCSRNEPPRSRP